MTTELSIGALEKSARTWAKSLEKLGLKVEVDVFRCGRGGGKHYGQSFVELEVTAPYKDDEGDEMEAWATVRFVADGYTVDGVPGAFDTADGFKVAKARAELYLARSLRTQGWKLEALVL